MAIGTTAAILGGVGAAVAAGSTAAGAVARGSAASAEGRAMQDREAFARSQQAKVEAAAEPTLDELKQLQKQIEVSDRAIARQEELLKAVDPALIEASQQALRLMKGEAAGSTKPIENARARQRVQLANRLREQLGPGFETSSAGIEALSRFDSETADAVQNAQQTALGGITNFLASSAKFRPDVAQMASLSALPSSTMAGIANRRVAAMQGGLSTIGAMGSANAAQALQHQATADTFSDISQLGGSLIGFGAKFLKPSDGSSGGAQAPTTSAAPATPEKKP